MRVTVYFRPWGEIKFQKLPGSKEVSDLPAEDNKVRVTVDGKLTQARVIKCREFTARPRGPAREPSLYVEGDEPPKKKPRR